MRFRHAPLSPLVAAASLVLGGAPASAGPRSHDPCAVNASFEDVCDAVTGDDLRYTCLGNANVTGTMHDRDVASTKAYYFDYHVVSYHECPNKLGDWVRVTGTLDFIFMGEPGQPVTCNDFRSCTNDYYNWSQEYVLPFARVEIQTVTSTINDPSATATDTFVYALP